jgi:PAS domain S-box-containing protein
MSQTGNLGSQGSLGRGAKVRSLRTKTSSRLRSLLDEQLRFHSLLMRLSATFVNLPAEMVDSQIEEGVRQIVDFLGVDRSSLAQFCEHGRGLRVTHSYAVPGLPPLQHADLAALWPWYTARIRVGDVLRFTRLPDDLPEAAEQEREHIVRYGGPRSHLSVPISVGKSVIGVIGFEAFQREREWPDDLVHSLQLVGEILGNALARKQADLALRESEARFRRMADAAPVMIWMSGPDKGCSYVSKSWLDFTGRRVEQDLGNGWSESVHPADVRQCIETYSQAFDARQAFRVKYRVRHFDGEYRWVLDTGVPRFGSDGTFEGYIGSCIDITDEKRAEDESRDLREQLAKVGRATLMGELTASIAHEVNQPLCAIVSNAEAIQRMLSDGGFVLEELLEGLRDIVQDSQRASAVVARIRSFLERAPGDHSLVDINDLIREVDALIHSKMVRRSVAVELDLDLNIPPVLGDRIQLQQVMLNFMINAADAMDGVASDKRRLTVQSSVDESRNVTIAIKDTGVGVNPGDANRIFEAFFTTKPGGLGMGLAICRRIVETHGGRIWTTSNGQCGSTFCVALPAVGETAL